MPLQAMEGHLGACRAALVQGEPAQEPPEQRTAELRSTAEVLEAQLRSEREKEEAAGRAMQQALESLRAGGRGRVGLGCCLCVLGGIQMRHCAHEQLPVLTARKPHCK